MLQDIENILEEKKATNIKVIPLIGKSSLADHMIIATAQSTRLLYAIAEHIAKHYKQHTDIIPTIEGKVPSEWVVVDAQDIIIHLFKPEAREIYNLEKMWTDPAK